MARVYAHGHRWCTDIRIQGRRFRRSYATKVEAEQAKDDLVKVQRAARWGELPKDVSWQFFKMRYLDFCEANKRPNTIYRDKLAFTRMEKAFPVRRLLDVTPELLERLKAKWQREGLKLSAVTRGIKSLKTAMRKAEDWKYTPLQNWRVVKVQEPKPRLLYYTMEELERLLKVCRGPWKTAVMLMGRAGLRSGEVYMLEWEDIEWDSHRIYIHPKDGWTPKGKRERRVDMEDTLERYLQSIQRPSGFVLGPDKMTLGSFQGYLKRLIKKSKLKGSPHTLRHTFASHLVSAGESLEVVGELLGHTKPETTKIYAHLMPHATRNAIKKLPKLMSV